MKSQHFSLISLKTSLLFSLFLYGFLGQTFISAQSTIANGGFEDWETRSLYDEFPPYGTSNRFLYLANSPIQANAFPVPGCSSPQAIRLENVLVHGEVQTGVMSIGNFGPNTYGGIPYTEQPDSVFLTLRYDIPPGDQGIFALFFTKADSSSVSSLFRSISGTQDTCVTIGFDLPSFQASPDFAAFLLSSGDLGNPSIEGGWIELDSLYFSGGVSQLPNASFENSVPLMVHEPVNWLSGNEIQAVIQGIDYLPMIEEETVAERVFEGGSALKVSSRVIITEEGGVADSSILGIVTNGQTLLGDLVGGQPYLGTLEDTLSGQYRYQPTGADTALVYLRFFSYDPIGDSSITILETGTALLPTESGYTCFQIPFSLSEMPDSVLIAFGSSDMDGIFSNATPGIGSTLWIDILDFVRCPITSLAPLPDVSNLRFFPNPATEKIHVQWTATPGEAYRLRLFASDGRLVASRDILPIQDTILVKEIIPLHKLATGYYFLHLSNDRGGILLTEKIIKR